MAAVKHPASSMETSVIDDAVDHLHARAFETISMWRSKELCDYVIHVQEKSFHCHALVLATSSPVLKTMILTKMQESREREANLEGIESDIMACIIEFMYTGTLEYHENQLQDFIKTADYLQMHKLKTFCSLRVPGSVTARNCISWIRIAESLHLDGVTNDAKKSFALNYKQVVKGSEFLQMEEEELESRLEDAQACCILGDDLVIGLVNWIIHDRHNRIEQLSHILQKIPIATCSRNFLLNMLESHAQIFDCQPLAYKLMHKTLLEKSKEDDTTDWEHKKLVVVGGEAPKCNIANKKGWVFENNAFTEFLNFSEDDELLGHSICQIPGGLMWTGGLYNSCRSFIISIGKWCQHADMPMERSHHGSVYNKGKILAIAGRNIQRKFRSMDILDLLTDKWTTGPEPPTVFFKPQVTSLDGTVYVLDVKECQLYELCMADGSGARAQGWQCVGEMPSDSPGCSMTSLDHRLYMAGGNNHQAAMYTPHTRTWSVLQGPRLVDNWGALVSWKGKVYLLAGCEAQPDQQKVEEYDPITDSWALCDWTLPTPLAFHFAFVLDWPR